MAEDIGVLDGALPLIRGDKPWSQRFRFWTDSAKETPIDLTGKTVRAQMRWAAQAGGSQTVTVTIADAEGGIADLSLAGADTLQLPFGRLVTLFVQIVDDDEETTKVRAAINVTEGYAS